MKFNNIVKISDKIVINTDKANKNGCTFYFTSPEANLNFKCDDGYFILTFSLTKNYFPEANLEKQQFEFTDDNIQIINTFEPNFITISKVNNQSLVENVDYKITKL